MRRTPLIVAASVVGTLLLVGVAEHLAAPPDPRAAALAQLQQALDGGPATAPSDEQTDAIPAPSEAPDTGIDPHEIADLAWVHTPPPGTREQVALRFMQALQRHDDLEALRQTFGVNIGATPITEEWQLHRVMNNVRTHSQLEGAAPCTNAKRFDEYEVIVHCGSLRVLVHVEVDRVPGVELERPWSPGIYRYPHTYAISTVGD